MGHLPRTLHFHKRQEACKQGNITTFTHGSLDVNLEKADQLHLLTAVRQPRGSEALWVVRTENWVEPAMGLVLMDFVLNLEVSKENDFI